MTPDELTKLDQQLSWAAARLIAEIRGGGGQLDDGRRVPPYEVLVETDTGEPIAWVLRAGGEWVDEPKPHVFPVESTPSAEVTGDAV